MKYRKYPTLRPSPTSYIEDHEIEQAIDFVENQINAEIPRVCGIDMAVKIHVRNDEFVLNEKNEIAMVDDGHGNQVPLIKPDSHKYSAQDKYISCCGLVVAQGLECYQDETLFPSGARCRIGDWIVFPKQEGTRVNYKGNALKLINDNFCKMVVQDPNDIGFDW